MGKYVPDTKPTKTDATIKCSRKSISKKMGASEEKGSWGL